MGRRPIPERELVYRGPLLPHGQNRVVICCISPPFGRLSTTPGKVIYVLLTRAPLYRGLPPFSCDLHVLGAPLTFALSQDQTLQLNFSIRETGCPVSQRSSLRELITSQIGRVALVTPVIPRDAGSVHLPKRYDVSRASVRAGDLVRESNRLDLQPGFQRSGELSCSRCPGALDRGRDLEEALALPPLASLSSSGGGVYRRPLSLSNLIFSDRLFSAAVAALFRAAPSSGGGVYRRAPTASTPLCAISTIALSGRRFLATHRAPGGR